MIYREGWSRRRKRSWPTPKSLDMGPETFGKQILNALAGRNTPVFGMENSVPSVHPTKAFAKPYRRYEETGEELKKAG